MKAFLICLVYATIVIVVTIYTKWFWLITVGFIPLICWKAWDDACRHLNEGLARIDRMGWAETEAGELSYIKYHDGAYEFSKIPKGWTEEKAIEWLEESQVKLPKLKEPS